MSDALLWNEIGNLYLKIGSSGDAIAAYTKAIELNPDSGWAYCNLGQAYFLAGEFGHALFLFRKSIQLMDTPENQVVVWNKIGDAYRALKDIDNAIQAYKKADALEMGASPSEQNAGRQSGNPAIFHEMMKTEKKEPETNNTGKGYGENHLPPDQAETKPPVSLIPDRISNLDGAASPASNHQDTARIVRGVENSPLPGGNPIIVIPSSDETAEKLTNEETSADEPVQLRNSVTINNKEDRILDRKSKCQSYIPRGIDDLEEILAKINIYENITRVTPTNDRAWDTLGKLYKSLGRYKDAIGAYQKAIEMAPDKEVYYYYLGLLFSVEQQHDDAIQAFRLVLRKNPDYVLAHSALAGIYHRMGLENKANHHIAIALPKMNNESTYNRACFYAICGDKELAFEYLHLALKNKDATIEWIKSDPDLDPIRTDPRYQELVSEKNQSAPENSNENYFSSELEGTHNRLLPILNQSLAR